jgi:quercetin dioxygenase-like cupin family protein
MSEDFVSVGKKIKEARTSKSITLNMLANETGFSIEKLKDIEEEREIPPVGAILRIARVLRIDSALLLEDEKSKINKRVQAYTERTENYAYTTLTPGAENKHIKAFRVSVPSMQDHKGVGYQHEGEEFVYVLSGNVEVTVGSNANRLSQGESLHFNSGIQHQLKNIGKDEAELLVVIYGP